MSTEESIVIEDTSSNYSRLVSWEVWNFMTIEHGVVSFDERNIVNIKGYNDSGKSAMLRALDVLFFNIKPNAQVGFIQDGKDYFRVQAVFSDGVIILRDKYINGQSLYEMYKDGVLVFTTKQGKMLTRVADVPEIIKDYLGMITCGSMILNSRSCFEKQLLVQTTGSENYKTLNVILKSEEIAVASELLNVDRNRMASDISSIDSEIIAYSNQIHCSEALDTRVIPILKQYDEALDRDENKLHSLESCKSLQGSLKEIPIIPELPNIDTKGLDILLKARGIQETISGMPDIPELSKIDMTQLNLLETLRARVSELNSLPDIPALPTIESERVFYLLDIKKLVEMLIENSKSLSDIDTRLQSISDEKAKLEKELLQSGRDFVRCGNCGELVEVNSAEHTHI